MYKNVDLQMPPHGHLRKGRLRQEDIILSCAAYQSLSLSNQHCSVQFLAVCE